MKGRFLALPLALALVSLAINPAAGIGDGSVRPLPLSSAKCRALIERGAPFRFDTDVGCIIINGIPTDRLIPLPFGQRKCETLIARGAPFTLGGSDTRAACFVIAII
jgi:hypothetical protein